MKTCSSCLVTLAVALSASLVANAVEHGKMYNTPEEAVAALGSATRAQDTNALYVLFGPAVLDLENPDRVQATNDFRTFTAAFDQGRRIVRESDSRCLLEVGDKFWPF